MVSASVGGAVLAGLSTSVLSAGWGAKCNRLRDGRQFSLYKPLIFRHLSVFVYSVLQKFLAG